MTVIIESENAIHIKRYFKTGNHREKILSNFKVNLLPGNYVAITAKEIHKIIQLSFPEELKLFRKLMKNIHKGLKFWGNDKDYELLKDNLKERL